MNIFLKAPSSKARSGLLISAKSYLADRFTPTIERIHLPEYDMPSGTIELTLVPNSTLEFSSRLSRIRRLILQYSQGFKPRYLDKDKLYINFRDHSPENWAHTLNFYMPLALYIKKSTIVRDDGREPVFVLPHTTPRYIKDVYNLFGVAHRISSSELIGDVISCDMKPFDCIRCFARDWVKEFYLKSDSYKKLKLESYDLGNKIFISRKDTRKIKNEAEVEGFLKSQGFKTVYAEDLSVKEQLQVFIHAKYIVAVHGAAIAPLLYTNTVDGHRLNLIEIFNPGHMTNFYRGMAGQVGAKWIGVRGQFTPDMAADAFNFEKRFLKYSLSDFIVDVDSLKFALEHIEFQND